MQRGQQQVEAIHVVSSQNIGLLACYIAVTCYLNWGMLILSKMVDS